MTLLVLSTSCSDQGPQLAVEGWARKPPAGACNTTPLLQEAIPISDLGARSCNRKGRTSLPAASEAAAVGSSAEEAEGMARVATESEAEKAPASVPSGNPSAYGRNSTPSWQLAKQAQIRQHNQAEVAAAEVAVAGAGAAAKAEERVLDTPCPSCHSRKPSWPVPNCPVSRLNSHRVL